VNYLKLSKFSYIVFVSVGVNEKNGIKWRPYKHLSHLDYADDVCFLPRSSDGLKEMCEKLNNYGEPACLKINVQKTKIIRKTQANGLYNEQITLHYTYTTELHYTTLTLQKEGGN
jgi:hypothetical protein